MQLDLSIIIPVYNGEKYIVKCLDSIFNQENIDFEVIVVDDKSTDNTVNVLGKFATDSRFKLVKQVENNRQGYCRNIGINKAGGKYLLFLDSDDYLVEDKNILSKCIEFMSTRDLDIIDCPYMLINKGVEIKNTLIDTGDVSGIDYLNKINVLSAVVWNKFFKREFILENNLTFKTRHHEDVSFNLESFLKASRVASCNLVFYNYIIQENSTTTSIPKASNVVNAVLFIKDTEQLYLKYKNVFQIEKCFFYSFIEAARVISRYQGDKNSISESLSEFKMLSKKYRKEMLNSKTLNIVLRNCLYVSPFFANRILTLLNK